MNPYLKKLKRGKDFKMLEKLNSLVPDLKELLEMLLVIESEERLTPVKFRAAGILAKSGMISGQEFKDEIGLAQSTSSELLSRMIVDGTVIKVLDKLDGRKAVFLLSEEGEDIYFRISAMRMKRMKLILGYLNDSEKKKLLSSITEISTLFKKLEE
ncbi:winged helix-turn-helix transcriptional regulator [Candidatus Dependentiae bacterium]|nr:winged helix-turn-helix transcriptional regulator [Candidatus Dependentiae bacterium]